MAFAFSPRLFASIAGVSLVILALAGCGSNGDEADFSPTPGPQETMAQEPQLEDLGGTEPDPGATGVMRVESLGGTFSADIPNSWGELPPESSEQAQADPNVTDVLGFWIAGTDIQSQHSIIILGQDPEEAATDAQSYWDTFFAPVEDPSVTVEYEIFESDFGREVLFVDAEGFGEEGLVADSLFFVFSDDQLVVGLISSPGQMDPEYRDLLRDVANSLDIV